METDAPAERDPRPWLLPGVFLLALALRLLAARGDLWLDEIWSLAHAQALESPFDVFTKLKHDNNHPLNTLVVMAIGPDAAPFWHRLPGVLAGSLAAVLATSVIGGTGRTRLVIAGVLMSLSYLLTHYASEARGYAYLQLFVVASVYFADRLAKEWRWSDALAVAGTSVLGFCSHLTFLWCFVGVLTFLVVRLLRGGFTNGRTLRVATAAGVPCLFVGWFWVVNLSEATVGDGPRQSAGQVALSALSLTAGGPELGAARYAFAAVVLVLTLVGAYRHAKRDPARLTLLAACLATPAIVIAVRQSDLLYPRYFLACVPLLLWSVAEGIAVLIERRNLHAALLGGALLAGYVGANAYQLADLARYGRGGYSDALALIRERTTEPEVTIGSNHDFRNALVLAYHARRSPPERPEAYVPRRELTADSPAWLLVCDQDADYQPQRDIALEVGSTYQLVKHFPYAGLSGWHWGVYRLDRPAPRDAGVQPSG